MNKHIRKSLKLVLTIFSCIICCEYIFSQQWNPNYSIGTVTGKYSFNYNQTPDQLMEVSPPLYDAAGFTLGYQWELSLLPLTGFGTAPGTSNQSSYTIPASSFTQTLYLKRKTYNAASPGNYVYSNTIKIQQVSAYWEDLNYVREHNILKSGQTDWEVIDALPIGEKLQTTTYIDGIGRPVQKVSRETATPSSGTLWGDMVKFSEYDPYGRELKQYLPYTTSTQSGKYKTAAATAQPQYYTTVYNETSAFNNITYEDNPLNRVKNVKSSGASWAAGFGNGATYDVNVTTDNVRIFTIQYAAGDYPVSPGAYPANTLYKTTSTDENNKRVIEYTNKSGQLILTKTQISDAPSAAHDGWICVYSVYDDFGLLRYRIQPEGVKWLDVNGWSFNSANGQVVLNEQCFRYDYDEQGRTILKKAPGAQPLRMVYDSRDRVVFMQDGNQAAKSPAEWTANLYDELDRVVITTLYRTTKTVAQLQADINSAATTTTVTITTAGDAVNNLVVNKRDVTVTEYKARNSIEFVSDDGGSFTSEDGASFETEIDPGTSTQPTTASVAVFSNPITSSNLNNPSVTTILKYLFYDDYSYAGAKTFDNGYDNTSAYPAGGEVLAIAITKRTLSVPTGSKTRVLGTNTFLISTIYYDETGNAVQTLEDNIKQGVDVTTMQYQWDGRLLSTHSKHSNFSNFSIVTKNLFDKLGRVSSMQKKFGTGSFNTLVGYSYDDMGRLKTKRLHPGYTATGKTELETLEYSYNLHNNITGINKDYALKTSGKYDKWGNFFGLYLGFDNRDNVFDADQLDGHVTGLLWNTQGDDAQRKYNYTYDHAGRLTSALFKEKQTPGGTWDNSKMDFTVSGTSGKITYTLNGNLLNMQHKGVIPGSQTPVVIDNLAYTYASFSNKLLKVKDNTTATATNGKSGDFKDGTNTGDDYVYDDNGNLVIDLNKNIKDLSGTGTDGIVYNYLDKPEQIKLAGKGTIKIVYDADGNKLQKLYTPEGSTTTTTSTYINQFVYKETKTGSSSSGVTLQYINFEEGRIRPVTPVSQDNGLDGLVVDGNIPLPNSKEGVFDFFIRDYQENVRMILTEEVHTGKNTATMETSRASVEEPYFGQSGAANEVAATRIGKPPGWQSNTSNSVSKLSKLTGKTIGPNSLLKVMAGDAISASTDYYYQANTSNANTNLVPAVVSSLVQALSGNTAASELLHGNTAAINTDLNASLPFADIADPDRANPGSLPRAYLNIMFFDERFNFVAENSLTSRVSQPGSGASPLALTGLKAPKNGYAFIYVSNESNEAVYFDNLQVLDARGRIVEENHYYSYGLKIAAISSTKMPNANEGAIDNKYLYNDKELIDEGDLDWYDYGFRMYDAQIGRFTQLDPLADYYPELSPYQYASLDPIANIDLDGLEGVTVTYVTKAAQQAGDIAFQTATPLIGSVAVKAVASKSSSFFSFLKKAAEAAIEFIPVVGAVKDIVQGIQNGDAIQVAIGAVSLVVDVVSLGAGTVAKGAAKYVAKEAAEQVAKKLAKKAAKEVTEKIEKQIVEKAGKKTVQTIEKNADEVLKKFDMPGCFIAGTSILSKDGLKNIENIVAGDSVWAYSDSLHIEKLQKVIIAVVRKVNRLYYIKIGEDIIVASKEHPFYIDGKWIAAENLKEGDTATLFGLKRKAITSVTRKDTIVNVYNFSVKDFKSYYVSSLNVLVHNTGAANPCAMQPPPKGFTPDQKALTDLTNEQLRINEKLTGKKALTNSQADDALEMGNDVNRGAQQQQKILDHRFTSGKNKAPGHFKHEGSNGHVHVGNANGGHVPVTN